MSKIIEAIKSRNMSLLLDLIESGCDVNEVDSWDLNPIQVALYGTDGDYVTNLEAARILLTHPLSRKHIDINSKYSLRFGPSRTLAFYAAGSNNVDIVNFLNCFGADFHYKADDGFTPLRWAIKSAAKKSAKRIIELGADVEYVKQQIQEDIDKLMAVINDEVRWEGRDAPAWTEKEWRRLDNQRKVLIEILHEHNGPSYIY